MTDRREQVQRLAAAGRLVSEACRLTEELADLNWLNGGVKHSTREIAAIAIGYFLELAGDVGDTTPGVKES